MQVGGESPGSSSFGGTVALSWLAVAKRRCRAEGLLTGSLRAKQSKEILSRTQCLQMF